MIPSDRARARDGRLAGLWILAPQGLRASPTRSIFVTLTFRVLTPMISTRHGRVQAPLVDRAGRRATATAGYRPVRPDRRHDVRAPRDRTDAAHDGRPSLTRAALLAPRRALRESRPLRPHGGAERQQRLDTDPYGPTDATASVDHGGVPVPCTTARAPRRALWETRPPPFRTGAVAWTVPAEPVTAAGAQEPPRSSARRASAAGAASPVRWTTERSAVRGRCDLCYQATVTARYRPVRPNDATASGHHGPYPCRTRQPAAVRMTGDRQVRSTIPDRRRRPGPDHGRDPQRHESRSPRHSSGRRACRRARAP
ncbi:hypothetical protein QFZ22_005660 [Streptomyces canus]|uniref:Uncharacterized protein n=1 Tax=Streptomyces canus TaxID=58343 RepID=A0AAW8FK62_9ACTN|nr:hypothetical protein [Streptomyces canus]